MYIVGSYTLAVIFCFVTMLCWGSWGNTQKLAAKSWRYELFYWDYVIGMVIFSLILAFTAGSIGLDMNEQDREHARTIVQKALSKQFSPEFLNRLDEIITFDQLDLDAIKRIVNVELKPLVKRIADLGYTVELDDEAREFVATKGYDVQFGARPLKRALQSYVEDGVCASTTSASSTWEIKNLVVEE